MEMIGEEGRALSVNKRDTQKNSWEQIMKFWKCQNEQAFLLASF